MKSGICPKCESAEVYGDMGSPHGKRVDGWAFTPLKTVLLVCGECGYLEFYVEEEAKLSKLREKFAKVE
jgi:predicted nucleic-acid-binding Zn-ribbon protein